MKIIKSLKNLGITAPVSTETAIFELEATGLETSNEKMKDISRKLSNPLKIQVF